jgi:hypothetical protein
MKAVLFLSAMVLGAGLAQANPNFECKVGKFPQWVTLEYSADLANGGSQKMVHVLGNASSPATAVTLEQLTGACETVKSMIGEQVSDGQTGPKYAGEVCKVYKTTNFKVPFFATQLLTLLFDTDAINKAPNTSDHSIEFKPAGMEDGSAISSAFVDKVIADEECTKMSK